MVVEISPAEATRIRVALGQKIEVERAKPESEIRRRSIAKYKELLEKFVSPAEKAFTSA